MEPGLSGRVSERVEHGPVVAQRLFTPTRGPLEVGQTLQNHKTLRSQGFGGLGQLPGSLIVFERVIVGEHASRPVTRLDHVADGLGYIATDAEVMSECFRISLGVIREALL